MCVCFLISLLRHKSREREREREWIEEKLQVRMDLVGESDVCPTCGFHQRVMEEGEGQ